MVEQDFGLKVQVCANGCKGIWFPHGELQQLDTATAGMGEALQAALKSPRVNDASRGQLKCPQCGVPMHAHRFQRDKDVNVDECYACGGFFLDAGELKEIRDHYMDDAGVKAYADQLIGDVDPSFVHDSTEMDWETKRFSASGHLAEKILGAHYWRKDFM
jgi:Zn-finger nucleic acid-binding protein